MPLTRKRVVLVGIETGGYGVDPTLAAATDAVLCRSADVGHEHTSIARPVQRNDLSPHADEPGPIHTTAEIVVELRGSGAVDVQPRWGPLLAACGCTVTENALTDVTITPLSATFPSCRIEIYTDGLLHVLAGARGTATIKWAAGDLCLVTFSMVGKYEAVTDVALPTPTYDVDERPFAALTAAGITWGGSASGVVAPEMTLDLGNEVQVMQSFNDATGVNTVEIVGRAPTLAFSPQVVTEAVEGFWTDLRAGTANALSASLGDGEVGNQFAITAPAAHLRVMNIGERDGLDVYDVTAMLARGAAGNDEWQIVIT